MKKLGFVIAAAITLLVCQAAQARAVDTLTASGAWQKKSNWSAQHPPTLEEEAVIPAGKEVRIEKSAVAGKLVDQGHITGFQPLKVFGSVYLAPGSFDLTNNLNLAGYGTLQAEDTIYYLEVNGNYTLSAPLHAGSFVSYHGSTLTTRGYQVTIDGETYPYWEAALQLGTSTYTTGYWLVFPAAGGGEIHAEAATIIVNGTSGYYGGVFKGEHWTYGNLTFASEIGESRATYTVLGALSFDSSTKMQANRTVTVGRLETNGTEAAPVRVSSTEPGTQYTIVIPHDEEVTGHLLLDDANVVGGTLYDPEGEGTGDSGVVFAPQP